LEQRKNILAWPVKIIKKKYLFLLLLVFPTLLMESGNLNQQNYAEQNIPLHKIDREKWKETTKNIEYNKEKKDEPSKEKQFSENGSIDLFKNWGAFAKYFFLGLALVLLILVIYFIFKKIVFKKNSTIKIKSITLENIEDNLQESDLDKFLRQALENGDYKLAIRIFYLIIIKTLSEKKLIEWKKNKPNHAYLQEMRNHEQYDTFSKLTHIFERIWYGDRIIDKINYEKIVNEFIDYRKFILDKKSS
jgi:hypothetical protein